MKNSPAKTQNLIFILIQKTEMSVKNLFLIAKFGLNENTGGRIFFKFLYQSNNLLPSTWNVKRKK